jgi:hypothetical protein
MGELAMFEVYKLTNPIQPEYEDVEQAHVRYLYDIAMDRVNGCMIDGREFVESPRVFDRHYTNSSTQTVTVITINDDDTFNQGSMLSYDTDNWLCMSVLNYHDQYLKGLFQRCNYKLRWQNENGEIIERWVVSQDASSYSSGTDGNKTLQYGADQIMIYVPCDEETIKVQRDKRFMIDTNTVFPTTYKLTRVDTTSRVINGVGYCIWLLTESQLDEQKDNVALMLCDYFTPPVVPTPDVIQYTGKPQVRCGGVAKKFTANSESTVTWSLVLLEAQTGYITLTNTGNNQCSVKCSANKALIGTSFRLVATCSEGEQDILIDVVGGV